MVIFHPVSTPGNTQSTTTGESKINYTPSSPSVSTHQQASGTYKDEIIGNTLYTSFVPKNVAISGYDTGKGGSYRISGGDSVLLPVNTNLYLKLTGEESNRSVGGVTNLVVDTRGIHGLSRNILRSWQLQRNYMEAGRNAEIDRSRAALKEVSMDSNANYLASGAYTIGEENPNKQQSILYKEPVANSLFNFHSIGSNPTLPKPIPNWKSPLPNWYEWVAAPVVGGLDITESAVRASAKVLYGRTFTKAEDFLPSYSLKNWKPFTPIQMFKTNLQRSNNLMADSDVRTLSIGVGAAMGAFMIPGASLALSLGFFSSGAYLAYTGFVERDTKKFGEGVFIGLLSIKDVYGVGKRAVTESIGSKTPYEEVFAGRLTGKRLQADTLGESLTTFYKEGGTKEIVNIPYEKGKGWYYNFQNLFDFKLADRVVVSSGSPSGLYSKNIAGIDVGGVPRGGEKGQAGIEDEFGIWAAPKGRVNPGFVGIGKGTSTPSEIAFFPDFRHTEPIASDFYSRGIVIYPKNIVNNPGFAGLNSFISSMKDTGFTIVSKRSMLGFGEVKKQYFSPLKTIELRTRTFIKGRNYLEGGTTEMEVGISPGQRLLPRFKFNRTRFDYTILNQKKLLGKEIPFTGDLVRLPKYNLKSDKALPEGIKPIKDVSIKTGFEELYGEEFGFLGGGNKKRGKLDIEAILAKDYESQSRYLKEKRRYQFKTSSRVFSPIKSYSNPFGSKSSIEFSRKSNYLSGFSGLSGISGISFPGLSSPPYNPRNNPPSIPPPSKPGYTPESFSSGVSIIGNNKKYSINSEEIFKKAKKRKGERKPFDIGFKVPFNPKYVASVEAAWFNIKGKASKTATMTGIEIRPIGG